MVDDTAPSPRRDTVVYLPGLDGTGRLLFGQQRLQLETDLHCHHYPQDRIQTYESLAEGAADHIRQSGGGRPVTVLAESFGGGVAIELAQRHGELIERLVLVNTFAHYPVRWLIRAGALLGRALPGRPSPPSTRKMRERFLFADDLPRTVRDRWWDCVSDVPMSALGRRLELIASLDRRDDLTGLTVETHVIVATDDRTVPPACGHQLAEAMPAARLIRVTGGHTVLAHPKFDLCDSLSSAAAASTAAASTDGTGG